MTQVINIRGKQFTDLLVVGYAGSRNGRAYWFCDCSCGNKDIAQIYGVHWATIIRLLQGKSWSHIGRRVSPFVSV